MIEELARIRYRSSDIAIETIGPRPGEKTYEELMSEEEIERSIELPKYFVHSTGNSTSFSQDRLRVSRHACQSGPPDRALQQ